MELETARLRLRHWRPQDRGPFFAINTEPEVLRFLTPLNRAGSDRILDHYEAHFAEHGYGQGAAAQQDEGGEFGGFDHIAMLARLFQPLG